MLALVAGLTARLAAQAKALQASDLPLAFHSGGMIVGQSRDQAGDAVAQLQGEVGSGGAHQLTHVLHAHLARALSDQAVRALGLAHGPVVCVGSLEGDAGGVTAGSDAGREAISRIESSRACTVAEIALSSPISQP